MDTYYLCYRTNLYSDKIERKALSLSANTEEKARQEARRLAEEIKTENQHACDFLLVKQTIVASQYEF